MDEGKTAKSTLEPSKGGIGIKLNTAKSTFAYTIMEKNILILLKGKNRTNKPKIKAIRAGLTTLTQCIIEQGIEPDQHFAQMKDDMKMIDDNEFILDSDPRKVSQSGIAQAENSEDSEDPKSSEDS